VSLRLPPGITPDEVLPLLQKRVAELSPAGVTLTVKPLHGGNGVLVPLDSIYMRAAEKALQDEWGKPPVFMREGGSIPIGEVFTRMLHAPVIFMGTGLPDDNVHAPNEKYSLPNYYHLIGQAIRFLEILGTDPAVVARPNVATKHTGEKSANGKTAKAGKASNGAEATSKQTKATAAVKPSGKAGSQA
jgi:hypothetical protein